MFSGNNLGDIIYPLCVVNARGIHFKKKKIERVKRKKKKKRAVREVPVLELLFFLFLAVFDFGKLTT